MDPDAAAALQAFVSYVHNQREFADVSSSSFRSRRDHALTMPSSSCYSICTVSVLNATRSPSHSLPFHTSIRRFFLGQSLSDKPRGGSRLMSALCHTKYHYLLNINREVTLIWYSPWTYTKILYLIIRYLPFIDIVFLLWCMSFSSFLLDGSELTRTKHHGDSPTSPWVSEGRLCLVIPYGFL